MEWAITTKDTRLFFRSKAAWASWLVVTALLVVTVFTASPSQSIHPVGVHDLLYVLFENVPFVYEAVIQTYFNVLLLVPLVAFAHSYGAIVEDRETGRLRVTLSMPCSRRGLYTSALASSLVTFLVPLLAALLVAGLALASIVGASTARGYGYVVLAACLLGLACVSIGVSMSAALSTSNRVVGALFAVYIVILILYPIGVLRSALPYGFLFLDPLFAATALMASSSPHIGMPGAVRGSEMGMVEQETIPFYLTEPFLVLVLLGWILLPALLGRWWITRLDLQ